MIHLITGSLGAGKTSNTLWDLITNSKYKDRPKYATHIPDFDYEAHGFEQVDKNDLENWVYWEDENDDFSTVSNFEKGSLILIDEADLFYPASLNEKNCPRWLREMARSRHHGLDFYIITQQSKMISSFLLGLLQSHIHYHRPNGSEQVTRYSWEHHQTNVYARSNRMLGLPQKVQVNPEVFKLYRSTVQNTRLKTPPVHIYKKLALALLPIIIAPFFVWYFMYYRHLPPESVEVSKTETTTKTTAQAAQNQTEKPLDVGLLDGQASTDNGLTVKDFIPPDPVMPWTAPAYQDLAKPTDFPRIAMCMSSNPTDNPEISHKFRSGKCLCFTQQYTPVDVPQNACLEMVKNGWFDNWATGRAQQDQVLSGKPDEVASRQAMNTKTN